MIQQEIKFFWPLTEQMELDLDYGPTHLYYRAKGIAGVHSMPIQGSIYEFKEPPKPSLVIDVDQCPITVRSQAKPNLIKQYLYKVLGIKWETK